MSKVPPEFKMYEDPKFVYTQLLLSDDCVDILKGLEQDDNFDINNTRDSKEYLIVDHLFEISVEKVFTKKSNEELYDIMIQIIKMGFNVNKLCTIVTKLRFVSDQVQCRPPLYYAFENCVVKNKFKYGIIDAILDNGYDVNLCNPNDKFDILDMVIDYVSAVEEENLCSREKIDNKVFTDDDYYTNHIAGYIEKILNLGEFDLPKKSSELFNVIFDIDAAWGRMLPIIDILVKNGAILGKYENIMKNKIKEYEYITNYSRKIFGE